jgi:acetyl esterase/lipase
MRHLVFSLLGLALLPALATPAPAQMSNMPEELRARLAEINPTWGKDILGNVATTLALYTPILAKAPKAGVMIERDLAYGPDARHRLDLHKPEGRTGVPIVVYLHGGAYVRGSRSVNAEVYGNVATYFARQGMLGVNGTYRLAPEAQWPAAAQDVGLLVQWLKANAAAHGGDPTRIYLIGHSAGATHVATFVYQKDLQAANGAGIAGIILMSGRYYFDPQPDDPNLKNFQAYFGTDESRYPAQSPINHVKTAKPLPTFIVISEYDNPDLDTQGALLFGALCERDRACPRFTRMDLHNHLSMVYQFNTADDALGRQILEFIRRGR